MRSRIFCVFCFLVLLIPAVVAAFFVLSIQPGTVHAQSTPDADTFLPLVHQGYTPQPTLTPIPSPTLAPGVQTHTPTASLTPTRTATPLFPTLPPPGSTATPTPQPGGTPTPTFTSTISPTPPPGSTATHTPTATPTGTAMPTAVPTATFAAGSSPVGIGLTVFKMGCDAMNGGVEVDPACWDDQQPAHFVTVNALRIDRYELTNRRYKTCVDAGGCTLPTSLASTTRTQYYGTDAFADYPVIHVTWQQAQNFCTWAGGRLPTEAEWEKAARHPSDNRVYPWGNTAPTCAHTNIWIDAGSNLCGVDDTTRIGAYSQDASYYGMSDMGGNVAEWVQDWYSETYYEISPQDNPQGPATGTLRVVRGGSWADQEVDTRATIRSWSAREQSYPMVGFRCVYAP